MPSESTTPATPPKRKARTVPEFWQVANKLYGESFGVRDTQALADAMEDFCEMDESEQRFYLAHLSYLQVEGLATNARKLDALIERLDDGLDLLEDALPALPAQPDATNTTTSLVDAPNGGDDLPPEPNPAAHQAPPVPDPTVTALVPDEVIIPEPQAKPPKGGKAGK